MTGEADGTGAMSPPQLHHVGATKVLTLRPLSPHGHHCLAPQRGANCLGRSRRKCIFHAHPRPCQKSHPQKSGLNHELLDMVYLSWEQGMEKAIEDAEMGMLSC